LDGRTLGDAGKRQKILPVAEPTVAGVNNVKFLYKHDVLKRM
jgi:hypothetical protein|tara:strand:- start:794 stop:919 length:126 start_codon:yes stop_codon:yes gene_type:complete